MKFSTVVRSMCAYASIPAVAELAYYTAKNRMIDGLIAEVILVILLCLVVFSCTDKGKKLLDKEG